VAASDEDVADVAAAGGDFPSEFVIALSVLETTSVMASVCVL